MIVDDCREMRELIRQTLEPWTRDVVECADGDEVLQRFAECRPDWTLMDYRMSRVDGLTAIRALRDRWPSARIMLLTGHDSAAVRQEALVRGAMSCLSKDHLSELPDRLRAAEALRPPHSNHPQP
jgi:CheY-like chemotaxis protein